MRKLLLTGLAVGAVAIGMATIPKVARGVDSRHFVTFNGNLCVPNSWGASQAIEHTQFGVDNPSSTAELVVDCPVTLDLPPVGTGYVWTISNVMLSAYDRNTTKDVTCSINLMNPWDGTITNVGSLSTSGGAPGAGLQAINGPVSLVSQGQGYYLECTIPRAQSNAVSHIQTYQFTWQML